MKYKFSKEMQQIINGLQVKSVILNAIKNCDDTLRTISTLIYKGENLDIEQIKQLRNAIAESLIDSMNISCGLWQSNLDEVFRVLKSCDSAIYNDGDNDIEIVF